MVKLLLNLKADTDIADDFEKTALHYASEKECDLEMLKLLVTSDPDRSTLEAQDNDGMTPLHVAAKTGNLCSVEFLVEAGSSLFSRNKSDNLPIHCAVENEYPEVVKYFLRKNRRLVNAPGTKKDLKSLDMACELDNPKVVKVLLKCGTSSVDDLDRALAISAANNSISCARICIKVYRANFTSFSSIRYSFLRMELM